MYKKILFCTDFSENSDYAFSYAFQMARDYKATLLLLHCIVEPVCYFWSTTPTAADEMVARHVERVEQEMNNRYLKKLESLKSYRIFIKDTEEGGAFFEIVKTAREESADLIVMGTRGRTGLEHLILGSTAENVVRKSPCPVLTVRLPDKKSSMI